MSAVSKDRIDHIAIAVENVEDAVDWYTSTFNCTISYKDDTWALLDFENVKIALVIPEQHPAHLAFIRENAEAYGALKTHRDGTQSCYIRDISGNPIEIMKPYQTPWEYSRQVKTGE